MTFIKNIKKILTKLKNTGTIDYTNSWIIIIFISKKIVSVKKLKSKFLTQIGGNKCHKN